MGKLKTINVDEEVWNALDALRWEYRVRSINSVLICLLKEVANLPDEVEENE